MQKILPKSSENIMPILSSFKERARSIYGRKLKKVILYCSHAKGIANQNSDIDLLIVLSDMESPFTEIERLSDIKFSIGLEHDVFISTNPVSEDSFPHSKLPIFKNVCRDGIEI
ncbi:MAG: nucleotidyltransferase domain-containing protein [Bacteroidales bacterium]|nr:nucleotidyltransferase domain-containing protein [Bacteroidales bacterium]